MKSKTPQRRNTGNPGTKRPLRATTVATPPVAATTVKRPTRQQRRAGTRSLPRSARPWSTLVQRQPAWVETWLGAHAMTWLVPLLMLPIVLVGFALTVGWKLQGLPLVDNDYWWHVGTGNWIIDHRAVPTTDPFSWPYQGVDWVAHEWLAELGLAATARGFGYAGTILLTAALAVAAYWLLLRAATLYGLSRRAALLLTLLWAGVFLRPGVLVVRPQVWTFALFGVLFAELAAYDTGRRRVLWILPPLFLVWVNLNLTALIGFMCLGAFALDRLLHRRLDRHLITVCALSGLALLVNPSGPNLIIAAFKYAGQNPIWHEFIFEWMSPKWSDRSHLGFFFTLPLIPFAVWHIYQRQPWPAVPFLILVYQAFGAVRFIPIAVMLAFVFAGWLVWQWGPRRGETTIPTMPLVPRQPWVLVPPVLALGLFLGVASTRDASQFHRTPNAITYPEVAATILQEQYPNARLFNVYDYGGYLIYRFGGSPGVFIDGRGEMFSDDFLRRYFDLIAGSAGWQEAFQWDKIDAVLVRQIDNLSKELPNTPGWTLVYADPYSVLYVRSEIVTP